MRAIRRLLYTLVILAVLAAIANVAAGRYAEKKAAQQVQTSLRLGTPPTVRFDAFPILLRIVQGHIPRATVDANDLIVNDLVVSRFHLSVDDVRASISGLLNGHGVVSVSGGDAYADVTQDALSDYLAKQKVSAKVTIGEGAVTVQTHATYAGQPRTLDATGSIAVTGTALVFTATSVKVDGGSPPKGFEDRSRRDASFRAELPPLPGQVRPKRITLHAGVGRLEADFGAKKLDLSSL